MGNKSGHKWSCVCCDLLRHDVCVQMESHPPSASDGKKEKREKKGTVWHDGGSKKQLGQKAKEALDKSKVCFQRNGMKRF